MENAVHEMYRTTQAENAVVGMKNAVPELITEVHKLKNAVPGMVFSSSRRIKLGTGVRLVLVVARIVDDRRQLVFCQFLKQQQQR
jgi:hypothetical protein